MQGCELHNGDAFTSAPSANPSTQRVAFRFVLRSAVGAIDSLWPQVPLYVRYSLDRFQANMAHPRQSRPDSGLGLSFENLSSCSVKVRVEFFERNALGNIARGHFWAAWPTA